MICAANRLGVWSVNGGEAMYKELYENLLELIAGRAVDFSDNNIRVIGSRFTANNDGLTGSLIIDGATNIIGQQFLNNKITSFSAKSATSIGAQCFQSCTRLISCEMPSIVSLSSVTSTFEGCTSLKYVDFSGVTSVPWNLSATNFKGCTAGLTVNFRSLSSSVLLSTPVCTSAQTATNHTPPNVVFECSDGNVVYDTASSAWVRVDR